MKDRHQTERIVASIELEGCPEGEVLHPFKPEDEITQKYFSGWEMPVSPRGGWQNRLSQLEVIKENGQPVLFFNAEASERVLICDASEFRDCKIVSQIKPLDVDAKPHMDKHDCHEALVGVIFRVQTSRTYYQFGIEGKRRAVLYRRIDDEWFVLAEQEVELPDDFLTMEVALDGDGIRCTCAELGVDFFCTDTTIKYGKVGIRSLGRSKFKYFKISQTPSQEARDERRRIRQKAKEEELGENIPNPVLVKTFDLNELGGSPTFKDFVEPGRYDMLISAGGSLRALTAEGQTLWETPVSAQKVVFSKEHGEHGCLLYGFDTLRTQPKALVKTGAPKWGEMVVIQGGDGAILARSECPEFHEMINLPDFSMNTGNFTNTGGFDIVLREWRRDGGNGGFNLWAYDKDLNLLWHRELHGTAWYGHHYAVQFYDVNGDGRDELLAGGTLFDADGRILWVHDRDEEVLRIGGAQHYDAVALGAFTEDEEIDPVAFLVAGSAGVYVVDGLTGRTRSFHRIGHAQGRVIGKVRNDIPGEQILVATRWGNMGILTLFSGHGDRLWTIQPDYIGQGSCPVKWGDVNPQLIWMNTTGPVQSFYDGYGRCVKELTELRRLWGERLRTNAGARPIRMGTDTTDFLCLSLDGNMYVFGPEN